MTIDKQMKSYLRGKDWMPITQLYRFAFDYNCYTQIEIKEAIERLKNTVEFGVKFEDGRQQVKLYPKVGKEFTDILKWL